MNTLHYHCEIYTPNKVSIDEAEDLVEAIIGDYSEEQEECEGCDSEDKDGCHACDSCTVNDKLRFFDYFGVGHGWTGAHINFNTTFDDSTFDGTCDVNKCDVMQIRKVPNDLTCATLVVADEFNNAIHICFHERFEWDEKTKKGEFKDGAMKDKTVKEMLKELKVSRKKGYLITVDYHN